MNYFPFHIGDYASATQHLTLEEDAMYRRLLDIYYTTEKPITLDERQVFRLTRASTDVHRDAVRTVLDEFFDRTDFGWVSKRVEAELEAMREKQQKQRDRANRRWAKPDTATENAIHKDAALPCSDSGIATAMPRHANHDAVAQIGDAVVMPPTPTPTPTPTPIKEEKNRVAAPSIPGVSAELVADWEKVRKAKRAGPLTETAVAGLLREAAKASISPSEAIAVCCEAGWQGFNATWYVDRMSRHGNGPPGLFSSPPARKHSGFQNLDYREGIASDGTFS